jgi:pre-rRNA-processing protein IPI3
MSGTPSSNTSLQSRITSLESEITELREQLGKAKGLNDVMWENVVQKVLGVESKKDVGEAARKRGRIS